MTRGRFISLEGGEGAGKSTQARLLADALQDLGHTVLLTREPGGTPGAEAIRKLLLEPDQNWGAEAEALLFAAARADHVAQAIRPALERGYWVVCDRFIDSSRAYQGGASGISDAALLTLHEIGSGGLRPDLTLLLTIPSEVAQQRLSARDGSESDRIGGRSADYHAQVASAFNHMAEIEPGRFAVIPAEGDAQEIHAQILHALSRLGAKDA